jgi:hypothetical protein
MHAGAKILEWYNFGPMADAFAMIGLHEKNHSMFRWIATANRMIADAEELLLPGTIPSSAIAILYPRSAWIWDNATSMHSGSPGSLPPACVATVNLYCGFAGGRADMCSTCIDAWPAQIQAAGCPARPAVLAYLLRATIFANYHSFSAFSALRHLLIFCGICCTKQVLHEHQCVWPRWRRGPRLV